ncbi:MAG: 8-amino-7-oxononanoate synthase [Deltaproteobacteria bacterium]|nr:8-amino-7-oxononanoate synthase [Deltaproteobacteria bacterium]
MDKYNFMTSALEERKKNHLLRSLKKVIPLAGAEVEVNGRKMLNLCSNDYLGLASHPLLKQRSVEYTNKYGAGSTASRLVCGNFDCFETLEDKLARLTGHESSLVFNSGFQANVSLLPALSDSDTLILSDFLNHNSIIQGCKLSRCYVNTFRHNDLDHLEELLKATAGAHSRIFIVTESIFSMDGDVCDIDSMISLSERYNSLLVVDEAHATGVTGKNGMGVSSNKNVDLVMGTFSKGVGSFGAYISSGSIIRDYLINFCNGLIYTTALPPAVIGAIDAALELIPGMEIERERLMANSDKLRTGLKEMGYDTGKSTTHIIPVIIGEEKDALRLSGWLEENNVLATTFRPPTVPRGQSRIRIALTAAHNETHVDQLLDLFRGWRR